MSFKVLIQFKDDQTRLFTATQQPFINEDNMVTIFEPDGGVFLCAKHCVASIYTRPLESPEDSFRNVKCEANGTG